MEKLYVVSIDEEFEKARTKGARDMKKRRRRTVSNDGYTPMEVGRVLASGSISQLKSKIEKVGRDIESAKESERKGYKAIGISDYLLGVQRKFKNKLKAAKGR